MFAGMFGSGARPMPSTGPDLSGAALREPIFYGGDFAYGFQYRDLAAKKYMADDPWLLNQMGFSIADAIRVVSAASVLQDKKVHASRNALQSIARENWTMLPGFMFTAEEAAKHAGLAVDIVKKVLSAFTFPGGNANAGFTSLHAYNAASGTPLLTKQTPGQYVFVAAVQPVRGIVRSRGVLLAGRRREVRSPRRWRTGGHFTEAFALERLSESVRRGARSTPTSTSGRARE